VIEQRVTVNQVALQIRQYESAGEPIIFLHFSGSNLMMWEPIISDFQDAYHLILVDLKGHGKSDRPPTGYHMDELASEVMGIMQNLEIERAHIVGSSLGAEVGLSLAANYPEKVLSLVCDGALSSEFGPYGTWEGSEAEFEAHVTSELEKIRNAPVPSYPSVDALVEERRALFEKYGWWNAYLEAVVRYDAYQTDNGNFTRGMGKQALENYMGHYYHYRFEDYYRKIKCPLMLLAEKDLEDAREKAAMQGLCELTERGEIVAVEGWAHPYCWFLTPESASRAILKFLEGTAHPG
jgi:pimeloyl-ACP methyl ester carboxylesterase